MTPYPTRQTPNVQDLHSQWFELNHHGSSRRRSVVTSTNILSFHCHWGIFKLRKALDLLFVGEIVLRRTILSSHFFFQCRSRISQCFAFIIIIIIVVVVVAIGGAVAVFVAASVVVIVIVPGIGFDC